MLDCLQLVRAARAFRKGVQARHVPANARSSHHREPVPRLAAVDDVISSACNGAPSRAERPLPSSSLHPHTDTVHAPKPLHPHCAGCCGSQCAHESAYSSSDRPHAYTRAQDTQPSHPARRAATARSRHTSHRERGVCTGERTFRGAIWARDHARPSNLAARPSPARRASTRAVIAFLIRGRSERGRFRVVSSRRPGTLSSAL